MDDERITPNAVHVYKALVLMIGVDRWGHLSHAEIAKKTGLDIGSIGPALFRLHWADHIERGDITATGRYYKVRFNPRTSCVIKPLRTVTLHASRVAKPRQAEQPRRRRRAGHYI